MRRRYAPLWYALLLGIGIPWYWPDGDRSLVLGMPAWVIVAIVAAFAASCVTAVLLRRPWPDEDSGSDE